MNSSEWQRICDEADIGHFIRAEALNNPQHDPCWKVTTQHHCFFVKTALKHQSAMFLAEQHNLDALRATATVRVPKVMATGHTHKTAWLVLEWLSLSQQGDWAALGVQLAQLHQHTQTTFGWVEDNTLEQMPQYNRQLNDWVSFFRSQRLVPQLRFATERGLPHRLLNQIQDCMLQLDVYFVDYLPTPSLVHGNLSMQSVGFLADGQPVLFDPACYFGDTETDMASAHDFPAPFHEHYRQYHPVHPQHNTHHALYQLYHHLVHFNRYGGQYVPSIEQALACINTVVHA
jgi:protein-ribulosamine 3-kinase